MGLGVYRILVYISLRHKHIVYLYIFEKMWVKRETFLDSRKNRKIIFYVVSTRHYINKWCVFKKKIVNEGKLNIFLV